MLVDVDGVEKNIYVSVACGQGMQVVRCMTKFLGIA